MEKKKLLVVDDSEAHLELFKSMFENDIRIEVLTRDNGKGIEQYCLMNRPDLILLDLLMPDVDGFQVMELLKANQALKDIPIVIISALRSQQDMKRAIDLGAIDYIVKPVDFEENAVDILKLLCLDYSEIVFSY